MKILNCKRNSYESYSAEIGDDGRIINAELNDGVKKHNTNKNIVLRLVRYKDMRSVYMYWKDYDWYIYDIEFKIGINYDQLYYILTNFRYMSKEYHIRLKNLCKFAESIIQYRQGGGSNV